MSDHGALTAEYAKNGVVVVRNAISPMWQDRLRDGIEDQLKKDLRYFAYRNVRLQGGPFQDFIENSDIGQALAQIAASRWISVIFDQIFVKEPGSQTRTGWHTDQPYWPVRGPILTAWIALDRVDAENGTFGVHSGQPCLGSDVSAVSDPQRWVIPGVSAD